MLESGDDDEAQTDKSGDESKELARVLYRKKQPLRLLNSVNLACVAGADLKQNAISNIIKFVGLVIIILYYHYYIFDIDN